MHRCESPGSNIAKGTSLCRESINHIVERRSMMLRTGLNLPGGALRKERLSLSRNYIVGKKDDVSQKYESPLSNLRKERLSLLRE